MGSHNIAVYGEVLEIGYCIRISSARCCNPKPNEKVTTKNSLLKLCEENGSSAGSLASTRHEMTHATPESCAYVRRSSAALALLAEGSACNQEDLTTQ